MKALLDTHALLWWLFDDPHLSTAARDCIANAGNEILVSAASAWEIATKHRIGKLPEAGDIVRRLPTYLRQARFAELSVTADDGLLAGSLPGPHKDPFDRMLIAQARLRSLPVLSIDPVFHEYGVTVVW
ncbi:MAG: type II toxin-antitoxin system VapC family toxin [Desulfurellaceae bacterium]|nr:type II toxin-antitoxin system VapC family toxin [Desulfurellaceae bacterium]